MKRTSSGQLTGDEVVISGMSGIFPSSNGIQQFSENLYNKVDMVTVDASLSHIKHPELPHHFGKIDDMDKFDAQFFRMTHGQAAAYDPMGRKVLEHAFRAIFDSGINPMTLSGTKLGVFIGSSQSDASTHCMYDVSERNKYIMAGTSLAMFANRISFWINSTSDSYNIDVTCASSIACLEHAYQKIKSGDCDAALVGGCNHFFHPMSSLNLRRYGLLCLDGKTKCFDKNGDGYVRSHAISVFFLQKSKDANRIYAEIMEVKGKYFASPDSHFLPLRQSEDIKKFLEEFYSEIKISPKVVEYIEANGMGIAEADGNELEAISQVFAKGNSIKIGSVKSNMGNAEAVSGACALTKVCLAYQKGLIPANLYYNEPQDHVSAVRDNSVQVVTENSPFNRGFAAINNFALSGVNYHVLLKGHFIKKNNKRYKVSIPYLILISGREEVSVNKMLDKLEIIPVDPEQIALLHNIYKNNIPGNTGRGYTVIDSTKNNDTKSLVKSFQFYSGNTRPVWFLYSGMGSQWAGMAADLMRIPIFAVAIERCHKVLEPKGVDVIKIITEPDDNVFSNILNCMVGIAAMQIALTEVLKVMGVVPDNMIGHSVGELGCAYADGCITAEEMMLSSFNRGLVSIQTKLTRGSMAAVGLGRKAIIPLCPPEIDVACYNSSESTTISGPADIMDNFVAELSRRGIFAKKVATSNIAYHSRYIAPAAPDLLSFLNEFIRDPKARSKKWISTSVLQEKWDSQAAKYASAEYFTNNLLSPVYFEEAAAMIPKNAIVIEIAPHGLLQPIIRRSHKTCTHIPLTRRGKSNGVLFLLEAIGKLFQAGLNPKVDVLYPKVDFPVSTTTPILSDVVSWEHSNTWRLRKFKMPMHTKMIARKFIISIHDDDYIYIKGHIRNGANVFPEAAILVLVWETLAMYKGVDYRNLSVVFRNVKFFGEVIIKPEAVLKLDITIQKKSKRFEVLYENSLIASGYISDETHNVSEQLSSDDDGTHLDADAIYTLLRMKGYSYEDKFQSIHSINMGLNAASIKWIGEWTTFLDSLIQFNALARDHVGVSTPKFINILSINVENHKILKKSDNITYYNGQLSKGLYGVTWCGGVKIETIAFNDKPKNKGTKEILLTRNFFPYFPSKDNNLQTVLQINLQLVAENTASNVIKITEFNAGGSTILKNSINKIAKTIQMFGIELQYKNIKTDKNIEVLTQEADIKMSDLFVVHNFLDDKKKIMTFSDVLCKRMFILAVEKNIELRNDYKLHNLDIITNMSIGQQKIILFKKIELVDLENTILLKKRNIELQTLLQNNNHAVILSENQPNVHVQGLLRHLGKAKFNKVNQFIIQDKDAPSFSLKHKIYKAQLNKNLAINVFKEGQWGGYYYLPVNLFVKLGNVKLINKEGDNTDVLKWTEVPIIPKSNTPVEVYYAGITLNDCRNAVDVNIKTTTFGMDFSGIDIRGRKVMGLMSGGAIASTIEADPDLLWPVPEHWSLEDAATVPLPYVHAFYCLSLKSSILRRQTIFVSDGAEPLGQAIISLSLSLDCTVYTTVSDKAKKRFLLKMFPQLDENNIGDSNDIEFHNMVIFNTKNKGCDIVISCYNGPLRKAAMACGGELSFFLDISDNDMKANEDFDMFYLDQGKTYKTVHISSIFLSDYSGDKKILQRFLSEGIAQGIVKPLSRVVYSSAEISRALRLLPMNRNPAKVLIKMKDAISRHDLRGFSSTTLPSDYVYIVVCDESELGIELVDRLVKRGARKVIVHVKPNCLGGYFQFKLASWKRHNVAIVVNSENLQTENGCENLFKVASSFGRIHGIFIAQNYVKKPSDFKFDENINELNVTISNVDVSSRKNAIDLCYFMVIAVTPRDFDNEHALLLTEKKCEMRNDIGLPALVLHSELSNNEDNLTPKQSFEKLSTLFNALEISLKFNRGNIMLFDSGKSKQEDFLQNIAKLLSISHIDNSMTLGELHINLEEIKNALATTFKISYSTDDLQCMTSERYKKITNLLKMPNTKFNAGLGAFIKYVGDDEILNAEPIVTMTTVLSNENELELDPAETYLMMLPGFEGHHQALTSVAERLKIRAICLQLIPSLMEDTIPKMASSLMNYIKRKFKLKSKFYIIGYSFGVNIALELAALLEQEGYTGVVYCLDSSPDALRIQLCAYLGNLSDQQLQNNIIKHIYYLITGKYSQGLENDLEKIKNWSEKVDIFIYRVKKVVTYSHEFLKSYSQAVYQRMILAREYSPDLKLQSELILLKGIPHPKSEELADDYGLSKYTMQPVRIFGIASDHASAPQDCRVPNIVNKLLDLKLIEDLKNMNLCGYYDSSN